MLRVFEDLKQQFPEFIGLYIDFYYVYSREKFLRLLSREYGRKTGWTLEKIVSFFTDVVKNVQPVISLDAEGNPQLELSLSQSTRPGAFDEIVGLPARLAEQGKLVCVLFDEFQEIVRLNGHDFQRELRSIIQHHSHVSYIFCGSKQHLISQIFSRQDSPLYNIGKMKSIAKIPADDFVRFIAEEVKTVQPEFDHDAALAVYNEANGIPYFVQMLAYEYFNLALLNKDSSPETLLEYAIMNILGERNEEYTAVWERLSPAQKKTIEIVMQTDGRNLFRKDNLASYQMAASTLKKALNVLVEKGVLLRAEQQYEFVDVFFMKWLMQTV